MDVVLGVAVTGRVARLAMVGAPGSGGEVFDQYALDLPDGGMTDLAETIVGTYREVAETGNRVAAIRLVVPDPSQAETLRQQVVGAGVPNVELVSETEAATAVARSVGADAALLLAGDDTVSLTRVGQDIGEDGPSTSVLASMPIGAAGAAVASATVLASLPSGAETVRIVLVGQRLDLNSVAAELSSTAPVEVPPDAGYAIARGAAQSAPSSGASAGASTMMAPAIGGAPAMVLPVGDATQMAPVADATQMAPVSDATQMAPAVGEATQAVPAPTDAAAVGPQLAYSQEEPEPYELPYEQLEEFVPELEDEQAYTAMIAPPPPRTVLMGSAFAFVVVAFATLAVSVAVTIRPVADVTAQPPPPAQPQTVPGRFLPEVPHQPDPVALPIAVVSPAPAAPPAPRVPVNRVPVAPAPQVPVQVPAPVPGAPVVPPVPVPGVPVVPFNPYNPFPTFNPFPTWTTTVTTSVTPTTPTTPTTTPSTSTPTTPSTTPPTTPTTTAETTTEETVTPTEPSTISTVTPEPEPEPAYTPPPAQEEPAYTPPVQEAPAYTPPPVQEAPAYTPPAVEPEAPSSGGGGSYDEPVLTFPESP